MDKRIVSLAAHRSAHAYRAYAATDDGIVWSLAHDARRGAALAPMDRIQGARALASYAARGEDHLLVCAGDGEILHLRDGARRVRLGCAPGAVHVAVLPPAGHEHAMIFVAGADGRVLAGVLAGATLELTELARVRGGVEHLAALRGRDAAYVLSAAADGVVHAHAVGAHGSPRRIEAPGLRALAGYASPRDGRLHVVALLDDGDLIDLDLHGEKPAETILRLPDLHHAAAFWSPDDQRAHVALAGGDGGVHEVAYRGGGAYQLRSLRRIGTPIIDAPLDVGPDLPNPTSQSRPSPAGLTVALAGDVANRYAVSLDAGVWISTGDQPWAQLQESPRYAYSIATERGTSSHLAVGERNGDAVDARDEQVGVWESHDAGASFAYVLDPRSLGCTSRAVPALLFSGSGGLFVATELGVAARRAGDTGFSLVSDTQGAGFVTAFAASQVGAARRLWARTASTLFFSDDDGASWTKVTIPTVVGQYGVGFTSRGDAYSLAAYGARAVMTFKPQQGTTDAGVLQATGNQNTILYFDAAQGAWTTQLVSQTGDGTGLGGRRNAKSLSFDIVLPRPGGTPVVVTIERVYFIAGQQVYAGDPNSAGQLDWTLVADTSWDNGPKPIHADLWDVHSGGLFDTLWVCCDGGVYRQDPAHDTWVMWNQGLHTHHIHSIEAVGGDWSTRPQLAYTTSDNDQWVEGSSPWTKPALPWQGWGALGDSNWSRSDPAAPDVAILVRHRESALMTSFGAKPPAGAGFSDRQGVALDRYKQALDAQGQAYGVPPTFDDGPCAFQVIQTRAGDSVEPLLDVVMLADLPFTRWDGKSNVPVDPSAPTGQPTPSGSPALVRNRRFAASPDANVSNLAGDWTVEANDLPVGARRFWVSGTHAAPVYYLLVADRTHGLVIYKRSSPGSAWTPLNNVTPTLPQLDILSGGSFGPLFVNPYDDAHLYVLTRTGVQVSLDGGASFAVEQALTDLVTGGGAYPLVGAFGGGDGRDVIIASRANGMASLASMAFRRDAPHEVAAASPFTGVFHRLDATFARSAWVDRSLSLPRPHTPVSCIAMDVEGLYVATEGRGLVRLSMSFGFDYEPPRFIPQVIPRGDGPPIPGLSILAALPGVLGALGLARPRLAAGPVPTGEEVESDIEIENDGGGARAGGEERDG